MNTGTPDATLADPVVVPAGFPSLERPLGGGFRAGDLVVLGGDAGSGTTALALGFALRAAQRGVPTLFLSGEYAAPRLYERTLAAAAAVPLAMLRRSPLDDETHARVATAALRLRNAGPRLRQLDADGPTAVTRALDAHDTGDVRFVVVDGLESLIADPVGRDDALAWAVLAMKRLAVARGLVLLLVAHLPLLDRDRADRRPRLADFGVRGAVAVHADVALGLFREELYVRDPSLTGGAELHVLKHRQGGTAYADLYFAADGLRFEDVMEG